MTKMILTDALIDELHAFRVGTMARSIASLRGAFPAAQGRAIGSGFANFVGDGSPLTQAYGIGHRNSAFDLAEIDEFYDGLATNWELIVTPLLRLATQAGYVPDHFETVLAQTAHQTTVEEIPGIEIEEVTGDTTDWMKATEAGWTESTELPVELSEFSHVMGAYPARNYLARVDSEPAASAALVCFEGKYLFAGASTRPQFRGRGLQRALTQRRLADAGAGAFVQVTAIPGSQSHRNLQRVGFQPLYSKLVLFRRGEPAQAVD